MAININKSIGLFLVLLFGVSCGDLTGSSTGANNIENIATVEVGGIHAVNAGTNRFLLEGFADNGGYSGHNFRLRFRLPEGETVKFFFFSSQKSLAGGVEVLWTRSQGKVAMEISLNGYTHKHQIPVFDDREEIDVDMDVHNNHSDIHILVWDRLGSHGYREDCTFDGECLYNTEDFSFDIWLGVGRASGVYWGVQGNTDLIQKLEGPLAPLTNV